jgi:hypothetical protein
MFTQIAQTSEAGVRQCDAAPPCTGSTMIAPTVGRRACVRRRAKRQVDKLGNSGPKAFGHLSSPQL